jgi:hypothetical protein
MKTQVATRRNVHNHLVGLTLTGVHKDKDGYLLLDLSDGGILYASIDDDGNGPGQLISQHPLVDGRQATVLHFVDPTAGVASMVQVFTEPKATR